MSASHQSAQTDRTNGTDGTVNDRLYAVPLRGGEVVWTKDPPTKEVRMCFKDSPSAKPAGWNASLLPAISKAGSSTSPTLFPVTRQLVSHADTEESSKVAQSGGKQ